jgi:anti-sigma factor RsiW
VNRDTIRDRNMTDRTQLERWLEAEDGEHDDAADAAFAQLFAAVPKVEPMPTFVAQAVTAAWRWRARRRRLVALAWAATILLVLAGVAIAYFASPRLATVGVKALAFASGHAVPWLIAYATVAMNWWWTLAHVGGVIASALMTPARAAAIFGVELFGILAFFALQRIAGAGRFGDAQV